MAQGGGYVEAISAEKGEVCYLELQRGGMRDLDGRGAGQVEAKGAVSVSAGWDGDVGGRC